MTPKFFRTSQQFRTWLRQHHGKARELVVGFRRLATGKASITWPEAVDEALCFGWVDGVRKRIDDGSYAIRFTPRRASSTWSAVNIARATELTARGLMTAAGSAAFERRTEKKSRTYSYERAKAKELDAALAKLLRADPEHWKFHEAQPPSYRRRVVHWIMGTKSEDARLRRLQQLLAAYSKGRRL